MLDLLTTRARVLFTSTLSTAEYITRGDADAAIQATVRTKGTHACAVHVAGEYGDHPETAAPRMAWALNTVRRLYTHPLPGSTRKALRNGHLS